MIEGIDISNNQPTIDWRKVSQSDIRFCFIKASEGAHFKDPLFAKYWDGAQAVSLFPGAYHFFRPKDSVQDQINNFCSMVKTVGGNQLPHVLDLEVPNDWAPFDIQTRKDMILTWLNGVEKITNKKSMIYLSPSFIPDVLHDAAFLAPYLLWIAHYTQAPQPGTPSPWKTWTFWQYTQTGSVTGIKGAVDCDRFNGTFDQLSNIAISS